jgi:hypothetical protein
MSPSFFSKNGVRYLFYVSTAALRGRKDNAGSVKRLSAPEIEGIVEDAVRQKLKGQDISRQDLADGVERVVVQTKTILVALKPNGTHESASTETIEIPWVRNTPKQFVASPSPSDGKPDQKLLQAVVRAHAWVAELTNRRFASVEDLAVAVNLHPKVVRQALKLAFLAPNIAGPTLTSGCNYDLADFRNIFALSWQKQLEELHQSRPPRHST